MTTFKTGQSSPPENKTSGLMFTVSAPPEHATDVTQAIHDITASFIAVEGVPENDLQEQDRTRGEFTLSFKFDDQLASNDKDLPEMINREIKQRLNGSAAEIRCDTVAVAPPAGSQKEPAFWKRWAVSMLGVYPLLIMIFYALRPVTEGLPVPVSLFLVALVLTGLNGRYVMPFLARKMQFWFAR
ncbi:MAG: hypothetical protein ACU0CB_13305 [Roseovarius sp.]|jgi:antibiotic biosynthesis monooxygenase (ABM) superfamily enzyme|nr:MULTISPECIES: hypothetical protein [Rhodobacterales]